VPAAGGWRRVHTIREPIGVPGPGSLIEPDAAGGAVIPRAAVTELVIPEYIGQPVTVEIGDSRYKAVIGCGRGTGNRAESSITIADPVHEREGAATNHGSRIVRIPPWAPEDVGLTITVEVDYCGEPFIEHSIREVGRHGNKAAIAIP